MRKPRTEVPSVEDVAAGRYDAPFWLEGYTRLALAAASREATRKRGASGGALTAVLSGMLDTGAVEGVLSVGNTADPFNPGYVLASSAEELPSGSVYQYIPLEKLKNGLKAAAGKRVAVVCQPCFVPYLRRMQERGGVDIALIVSFFCGYNMTAGATPWLVRKTGVRLRDVSSIEYRGGGYPGGFTVESVSGDTVSFGKEVYELANLMFLRKGCHACSLYMGEGADLVAGDAWLTDHPELSAVVCRTEAGETAFMDSLRAGAVTGFHLDETLLVRMHRHNLAYKKHGHSAAMRMLVRLFRDVLPRRFVPLAPFAFLSRLRRKRKIGVAAGALDPIKP